MSENYTLIHHGALREFETKLENLQEDLHRIKKLTSEIQSHSSKGIESTCVVRSPRKFLK